MPFAKCPECGYLVVDVTKPCVSCGAEIKMPASAVPPTTAEARADSNNIVLATYDQPTIWERICERKLLILVISIVLILLISFPKLFALVLLLSYWGLLLSPIFIYRRFIAPRLDERTRMKVKVVGNTLIVAFLFILFLFGRVYYGEGIFRIATKSGPGFKDTFVNLSDIFGMPRIVVATRHPQVKRQLEEMGIIKTDEEIAQEIQRKVEEEMKASERRWQLNMQEAEIRQEEMMREWEREMRKYQ